MEEETKTPNNITLDELATMVASGFLEIKNELLEVKDDLKIVKIDIKGLKGDVAEMKYDVRVLKRDVTELISGQERVWLRLDNLTPKLEHNELKKKVELLETNNRD